MTGPVFTRTYGYSGSEIDPIARNLVSTGYLSGLIKALRQIQQPCGPGKVDAVPEAVAPYE